MQITMRIFAILFLATTIQCTQKDSYSGYQLLSKEQVPAIASEVVQLKHKHSGAHLVLIKNQDQARSFMVGFRTPPYDDTGLFHIFEHAVLEGSRLYPSKSNFFHLANSSVAAFINAMTGPVYTLYPFVTRSEKDFDNLFSVYLDAVFFPNVLNDPRIIQREGWRYEVNPDTKKMSINGIVLSEMKGAYASPYRSLWQEVSRAMVPDTPFAFSSGGLPEKVATLTFEQIREAHKKYYHPQNSVVLLYGDVDYKKTLATLDKDFLSHFKATEDFQRPAIPVQADFNYKEKIVEKTYPGEKGPKKDFLAKGIVMGQSLTPLDESAAAVLLQAFVDNNAAPLKLRILREGLANSTFNMSVGGEENATSFVFEGSQVENLEKIEQVFNEEVERVIKEGLDPELLNSILNKYEFSFKEKNSNGSMKGLQMAYLVLDNWIFQDQPLVEALDFVTHFKKLRLLLSDQEYVKDFFKTYLRDNEKKRWVVLRPDPQFSEKFNAGLDKQVENALKEKPIEEYLKAHQEYEAWVAAKEPQEVIGKVPTLELKDIAEDEKPITMNSTQLGQTELLSFPQSTTGINYLNLYFDLSGVDETNLRNLQLFTSTIKRTDTKNFGFEALSKQLDTFIGGLGFNVSSFQSVKDPNKFRPTLVVSARFINENREKAMELITEVLNNSLFAPEKRLADLLAETKTGMISGISGRAPGLSAQAATRNFYPNIGSFLESIGGGTFENYVLKSEIDVKQLQAQLQQVRRDVFNQSRLYLATLTADASDLEPLKKAVEKVKQNLSQDPVAEQTWSFATQKPYDGYAIPGEVQYVAQAASYRKHGQTYHGSMEVYSRFLNNNYMIPKLREQAGAYGGSAGFSKNGLFTMSTYRDPNLKKSLEIFSQAVDFMEKEKFDAETLKPAILGSLKSYYSDNSVFDKTMFMTNLYLTDQSWADYMQTKREILETKPEDIARLNGVLRKALQESEKGVAGNPAKLKAEAQFLKNVLSIQ